MNGPSPEAIDRASRVLLEAAYRQGVLTPPADVKAAA